MEQRCLMNNVVHGAGVVHGADVVHGAGLLHVQHVFMDRRCS